MTEVSGSKTWDDNNDQDGVRPESITIRLLADGEEADSVTVTEADGWAWSFTDLLKYSDGTEITYTISEDAVEDYTATYDDYDVINTHTPGTVSVPVTKVWEDEDDADGIRPNSVLVELYKNGESTGRVLILSEDNDWTDSFPDLDEYNEGVKNVYAVEELDVEGYTAEITGDADAGFVVTNTHTPDNGNPDTGNPDTGNPNDGNHGGSSGSGGTGSGSGTSGTGSAKTADTNATLWYLLIAIAAAALVAGSVTVRARRQKTRN